MAEAAATEPSDPGVRSPGSPRNAGNNAAGRRWPAALVTDYWAGTIL
jgi:hypothetical protein